MLGEDLLFAAIILRGAIGFLTGLVPLALAVYHQRPMLGMLLWLATIIASAAFGIFGAAAGTMIGAMIALSVSGPASSERKFTQAEVEEIVARAIKARDDEIRQR